jgi:hypothetical protein
LHVHGKRDELIPFAEAEGLFAAANEPRQLYGVPGAGITMCPSPPDPTTVKPCAPGWTDTPPSASKSASADSIHSLFRRHQAGNKMAHSRIAPTAGSKASFRRYQSTFMIPPRKLRSRKSRRRSPGPSICRGRHDGRPAQRRSTRSPAPPATRGTNPAAEC